MASRKDKLSQYRTLDSNEIMALSAQKKPHLPQPYACPDSKSTYDTIMLPAGSDMHYGTNLPAKSDPKLKELHARLIAIGGTDTLLPDIEEDIDNILKYGQLWDNIATVRMRGRPSQCHKNSIELWRNNLDKETFKVTICTGYALSDDGLWRQHSWLIQMKPRANVLIETTEPRIAYYGFAMTYDQSEQFEYDNL